MKLTKYIFLCTTLVMLAMSCKKPAVDVMPNLEGYWQKDLSCYDPCEFSGLTIKSDGTGSFQTSTDMFGRSTRYEGKIKLNKENVLFVDGREFFEIYEIKDTTGYYVMGEDCYCVSVSMDSVTFSRIMNTSKGPRYIFDI